MRNKGFRRQADSVTCSVAKQAEKPTSPDRIEHIPPF